MDKLWAPWRIKYIQGKKPIRCIFCNKKKKKNDKKNYVILRKKYAFSMLNIFPYNNGHILIAPYRHIAGFEQLKTAEILEIFELINLMIKKLKSKLRPQGFNIGVNLGKVAGAGVDKHLHIHIVPRWQADTNFMPILSQTKVISQSLDELYTVLKS